VQQVGHLRDLGPQLRKTQLPLEMRWVALRVVDQGWCIWKALGGQRDGLVGALCRDSFGVGNFFKLSKCFGRFQLGKRLLDEQIQQVR
jgi:hypothetical protein